MGKAFADPAVRAKFAGYHGTQRAQLDAVRALVFEVAASTPGIGRIEENLKWGQPSYHTPETKAGTPLRIDAHPAGGAALYVNCQTDLIDQFRTHYPHLTYEGFRAVVLPADQALPENELRHIIGLTLTFHARKKRKR
jgi:hypothetical protein